MDFEWLAIGLLVLAIATTLARRHARVPVSNMPRRLDGPDAVINRQRRILDAARAVADPRAEHMGALVLEAGARLDPDIHRELEAVARETEAMWQGFRREFGHDGPPLTADQRAATDPTLVAAEVRLLRAVDEQLRRLSLPAAPRPDDWVERYAAGRVPLPPAPWSDRRFGVQPDPFSMVDPATLRTWWTEALHKAGGPLQRRLLRAFLKAAVAHPALTGIQIVPVPPDAGEHRNYRIAPVGEHYIHAFPSEPIMQGMIADLVLVAGVRGNVFQFTAVRIDPDGRARAFRDGDRHTRTRQALDQAGYRVFSVTRREADMDMKGVADRLCIVMAELFASHWAA